MNTELNQAFAAFEGHRRLAGGSLPVVTRAVKAAMDRGATQPILVYEDGTGRLTDIDLREIDKEIAALSQDVSQDVSQDAEGSRGRGRPKLGVVAREVTLLPRHWDWLASQPGGASVALRKLVEQARRSSGDKDRRRATQEAAYRFMSSIASDFPGFEEAARALFAYDRRRFGELIAAWPEDVRDYAIKLAFADLDPETNRE